MIELKNVSKYYNNNGLVTLGLRNINLKLYKNEIVAIVGDSGSGKSTLLNVICGVDTYEDGEMYFYGNETSYFNSNDMDVYRKEHIGFIFQNYNIVDSYTVLENVMLPMILRGIPEKEAKQRAKELIEKVGLKHRISNRGTKLSGGEKQRCVIARALAADCDILACDEPTGNLDSETGKEIIKLIKEVAKDKLVLIVTHDYEEVQDIVTRKIKISDGNVVEDYVIDEKEETEIKTLELEEKKISMFNLFKIAFKNIKSTPKKTLFTFLVFFAISIIAFYLYLSCTASSQSSVFNPDTSFKNFTYNRIVGFNQDHSPITDDGYKNIKGTYYENAFYEDISFETMLSKTDSTKKVFTIYSPYSIEHEHIGGKDILDEKDVYFILPKENLDKLSVEISPYIGSFLTIYNRTFNLVGVGCSDSVSTPILLCGSDISKLVISQTYRDYISLSIYIPSLDKEINVDKRKMVVGNPVIYIPASYSQYIDEMELSFVINELYPVITPESIEYRYVYGYSDFYFILPNDFVAEFEHVYEVSIYAEKPSTAYNQLEKLGLTVLRPSVDFAEVSQNQLLFIAYVIISTVVIMVLFFVSYIVLSRIYISKNKDYMVFRTLGIVKKKMCFVVSAEIIYISFVGTILAFITVYLLYFIFGIKYLNVVAYNNLGTTVIYFIVMYLFSYFTAQKFNKRLFKFSVQTSFKGEVARND